MDIYVTEYILGEGASSGIPDESLEKERMTGATQRSTFQKTVEAGATIVCGKDAGMYPHGQNAKHLTYDSFWHDTATSTAISSDSGCGSHGARLPSGKIKAGYAADFVAVERNPIEQIE